MEAVPLAVAVGPLALYLLALGLMNLRQRPTVIAGSTDAAALACAVSGLIVVGPMNLFLPAAAVIRFGPFAWLLLLGCYGLCAVLYILVARPRLVVFNISLDRFRSLLLPLAERLDHDVETAGDGLQMPQLSVQFHLEAAPAMRTVSLIATGDHQSYSGWKRLHRELSAELRKSEVRRNPRGFTLLACALALLGWTTLQLLQTPSAAIAQQLHDILRVW
jgi:hypothetical protein